MTHPVSSGRVLWQRQATMLARQEIGRSLFSRRSLAVYALAAMPIGLALLRALFLPESQRLHTGHTTTELAQIFHFFFLRFVVFFSTAVLFVKLYRGEILERSLHYHLLAPVRREVLTVGKYLGGLISSVLMLGVTLIATTILFYLPHGAGGFAHLGSGAGLREVFAYLAITALACAAYGGLFLLAGLFFKNPMVPAVVFLGWEVATPFLPGFLKMLSVVHYLGSLEPVPISQGPFALMAQPVPGWLAVLALLLIAAGLIVLAAWKARRLEITYATE
ncbi:MAG: ABC transporter permease [Thermoanaerobaculales bacterium]|jgi:ABC-type transport system involved in multi-copper enzyme maturation permease subunit|nr:ABC transporter permease [Thermoanaerobaculales bacterium]